MNDENKMTMTFEFRHESNDTTEVMAFEVGDDERWQEVARRFSNFLSAVYGYPIDITDA